MKDFSLLLGRIFIAALFILAGVNKILTFENTTVSIHDTLKAQMGDQYVNIAEPVNEWLAELDITLPATESKEMQSTETESTETTVETTEESPTAEPIKFAHVLTGLTIGLELLGGIFIILGWGTRFFAVTIFLFLIPVNYLFHPFWAINDAVEMQVEIMIFMKNVAIMGGLLMLAAAGPGKLSVSGGDRDDGLNL